MLRVLRLATPPGQRPPACACAADSSPPSGCDARISPLLPGLALGIDRGRARRTTRPRSSVIVYSMTGTMLVSSSGGAPRSRHRAGERVEHGSWSWSRRSPSPRGRARDRRARARAARRLRLHALDVRSQRGRAPSSAPQPPSSPSWCACSRRHRLELRRDAPRRSAGARRQLRRVPDPRPRPSAAITCPGYAITAMRLLRRGRGAGAAG